MLAKIFRKNLYSTNKYDINSLIPKSFSSNFSKNLKIFNENNINYINENEREYNNDNKNNFNYKIFLGIIPFFLYLSYTKNKKSFCFKANNKELERVSNLIETEIRNLEFKYEGKLRREPIK